MAAVMPPERFMNRQAFTGGGKERLRSVGEDGDRGNVTARRT